MNDEGDALEHFTGTELGAMILGGVVVVLLAVAVVWYLWGGDRKE